MLFRGCCQTVLMVVQTGSEGRQDYACGDGEKPLCERKTGELQACIVFGSQGRNVTVCIFVTEKLRVKNCDVLLFT